MKYLESEGLSGIVKGCQVVAIAVPSSVIRYRKGQRWSVLEDIIISETGIQYKKEVSMVMTLVATAIRYGKKGCHVSLDMAAYAAANKMTGQGISYKKTKALLETLDSLGYIELFIGYYDVAKSIGIQSFFLITEKMRDLWEGMDVATAPKIEQVGVVIKDSKTKEEKSTKGVRGVTLVKKDLDTYNKVLSANKIVVGGEEVDVAYKRVFHDTLQGSGRYYSNNGVQTIPKQERQHITINGYETVELDYSAMHPRILYSIEDIRIHDWWCPYTVPGVDRQAAKMALLCMFNSESRVSACAAMRTKGFANAQDVVAAMEEHNKDITHHFYKTGMWKALHWLDSQIATKVLMALAGKGIVCLPWHDSFVVEEHIGPILEGVMYEAWADILGKTTTCNCKIEKKS